MGVLSSAPSAAGEEPVSARLHVTDLALLHLLVLRAGHPLEVPRVDAAWILPIRAGVSGFVRVARRGTLVPLTDEPGNQRDLAAAPTHLNDWAPVTAPLHAMRPDPHPTLVEVVGELDFGPNAVP